MIEVAASHEYQRAAALRQATWQLLEEYTRRRVGEEQDSKIIVALQDAANRLGAVERSLLEHPGNTRDAERSGAPTVAPSEHDDSAQSVPDPHLTDEAAIVLTLAEVFVPLASSRVDEAERWLRIMHGYGTVGQGLQELGMPCGQLSTPSLPPRHGLSPVAAVASEAAHFADERGAPAIATIDVLFAVILLYGPLFDRALYTATGKRRSDLLATLVGREHVAAYGPTDWDPKGAASVGRRRSGQRPPGREPISRTEQ